MGATIAAAGSSAVKLDGLVSKVIVPAVASPIVAGMVAAIGVFLVYRMIRRYSPDRSEREFRWGQVGSSSIVALAHGTNDAQKTMGVICLALIANGSISGGDNYHVPDWVVVSCATAIALGTDVGGWRIIKTLGTKVVEVRPPQGFGSETVGGNGDPRLLARRLPALDHTSGLGCRRGLGGLGARARSSTGSSRATS